MFLTRQPAVLVLLLLGTVAAQAQDEELRYQLNGKVYDKDSISPLGMAYVIIRQVEGGTASDAQGRFTLYVKFTDTLQVTYTGMETKVIPVSNIVKPGTREGATITIKIYMVPRVVKLQQARVVAIRPPPSRITDKQFYEGLIQRYNEKPSMNMSNGFAVEGALSALIAPFTHKGKEMIKFEELYRKMEMERVVNKRFNDDLVHDLTGIDYDLIPDFRKFCGFTNEFVLGSKDYDFFLAIRKAYDRYLYAKYGLRQQQRN